VNTYMAKESDITRDWHVIDADGLTLGRLATVVANLLRGKHKPSFTPHVDTGDFVVIVNADKIHVTGKKIEQKLYRHHTGWPGGFRQKTFAQLHGDKPTRVIEIAVRGMLPHNRLGATQYTKLKVYAGPEHPHASQQPKTFVLNQKEQVNG
jgi:large subunit ribosomal protein L13